MIEVPQELIEFRDNLSGKTINMKNACSNLHNSVSTLNSSTSSSQDGIDKSYESENKPTLMNSFEGIKSSLTQIDSSVAELNGIIVRVDELINKINELCTLRDEINTLKTDLSNEESKEETKRDYSKISRLKVEIEEKTRQFEMKKDEALGEHSALKSEDISLSITASAGGSTTSTNIEVTGGEVVQKEFKYGKYKISYYLYVPEVNGDVKNLPVHMYLHGSGEMGNGILKRGLPKQLVDGVIKPSGIVICPQTGREDLYRDKGYQQALIELTKTVVNDYNGDKNRVSLSGHSYGANACYRLVKKEPGYFSSMVPISCGDYISNKDTESFKDIKIWAFHGDKDTHPGLATYSKNYEKTIKPLQDGGVDVNFTTLEGEGHDLQDKIVSEKFTDSNGKEINPIEWALSQTNA